MRSSVGKAKHVLICKTLWTVLPGRQSVMVLSQDGLLWPQLIRLNPLSLHYKIVHRHLRSQVSKGITILISFFEFLLTSSFQPSLPVMWGRTEFISAEISDHGGDKHAFDSPVGSLPLTRILGAINDRVIFSVAKEKLKTIYKNLEHWNFILNIY